eukprot:GHVR01056751.1.p1 GENE.GHVR01056751.1~~GHVR01056751.1.p1  ORF type:complete len:173 (+),score=69.54 GHVR01056751.1:281-799(+)
MIVTKSIIHTHTHTHTHKDTQLNLHDEQIVDDGEFKTGSRRSSCQMDDKPHTTKGRRGSDVSGMRRGSITVSAMRPEVIGEGGKFLPAGGRRASVDSTVASNIETDEFWEQHRAYKRHEKLVKRKPTGKFDYEKLSMRELKMRMTEAKEIQDVAMIDIIQMVIDKKEGKPIP